MATAGMAGMAVTMDMMMMDSGDLVSTVTNPYS